MKHQPSFSVRTVMKQHIAQRVIALFVLLVIMQINPSLVMAQSKEAAEAKAFKLPIPAGWTTEEFPLPPDFAPTFTWKGVEDIRFHPGWGDSTSKGYWSYAYLWWLEGTVSVTAPALKANFEAYYSGLVGRNIESRKIPAAKVVPTVAVIKKGKRVGNDKETYTGTISMLDYMTQRPMVLNCIVHVKDTHGKGKSAVMVEVSPQALGQSLWKELDAIPAGLTIQ